MRRSGKPRVLHLFNSFGAGGMERQALQLVRLLRESGRFEVHVGVQTREGPLGTEIAALGFPEVPAFPLKRLYDLEALVQVRRFAAHLRRLEVDVLHTHDFYTSTFGMAAALLANVPVRIAARRELDVFTPLQRRVEHLAYRSAHLVVANCERLRREVIREGLSPDRVVTVHNGTDPRRVAAPEGATRETLAASFGLSAERRVVGVVANLYNRKKDFETLLAAAAPVCRQFPDVVFVIAGDGGPRERDPIVRLAARLGIAERILLPGRFDRPAELLAISEVGVLSSRSEGLSNAVLEYMAAGLPVVATEVGGLPEAVVEGRTGHLVPAGRPAVLASRIASILGNPARARRMGLQGKQRIREHFSPEMLLSRTAGLYERLLARSRTARRP